MQQRGRKTRAGDGLKQEKKKKEREIHVPMATLFLPCDGFYVLEKSFDNILLPCIFLSIIALKVV